MKHFVVIAVLSPLLLVGAYLFLQSQGVPEVPAPVAGVPVDFSLEKPGDADWPCWRGPGSMGAHATSGPVFWSPAQGVVWKVPVPGFGLAAPINWGERVFVSTAAEQGRSLMCYHRDHGALLWQTAYSSGGFMAKHEKNSHASSTPACDGRHVYLAYAANDSLWMSAVDLQGRIAWQTKVGPYVSEHGYASAPVLFNDLVIVAGDNKGARLGHMTAISSYLAGLHRKTGEIVWRVRRPRAHSYGTPIVADVAGRPQLLLAGSGRIASHDPATGKELWHCEWSAKRPANSVVAGKDCVFASAAFPDPETICIRADGSGDVTSTHVVWRQRRAATDVPSPLLHENALYLINDKGIASCLDAGTGKVVWRQRLDGTFAASPIIAGKCIYATNEEGTTYVFKAGRQFEEVTKNSLNDAVLASPALVGKRLLARSKNFLWCLGEAQATARLERGRGMLAAE